MAFFNSISLKSSYVQFFFFFFPITRLYGNRVKKRHYRSLKRHYRILKNATIGLNSILRKSSFKRWVFLYLVWERSRMLFILLQKSRSQFCPSNSTYYVCNICSIVYKYFNKIFKKT